MHTLLAGARQADFIGVPFSGRLLCNRKPEPFMVEWQHSRAQESDSASKITNAAKTPSAYLWEKITDNCEKSSTAERLRITFQA